MAEHTNGFQLNFTTSLILAGLIFVATIFGGWITQSRDITSLTTSVVALATEQKVQDSRINLSSERIAILENNYKALDGKVCEIAKDVKELLKKK